MKLENRTAVIYGGGGAIGGAVARAFAREGAHVFLAGRTKEKLDRVAAAIRAEGGRADADTVDALDVRAVEQHADEVAARAGGIDIAMNAIGVAHVQGVPLAELSLEDYAFPITVYTWANFITARAVARHMSRERRGVILALTTPVSRMPGPGYLGHSVACAGVEALTRHLAGELGSFGIRVVCIRSHAIPEAVGAGSHSATVFRQVAERAGVQAGEGGDIVQTSLEGAAAATLLGRLPTLGQVAETAVFLASDGAGAMTGAIANLSCGFLLD
ncbi:SDR family NAD(P)-dependent oxidoreductase [Vulgatibacter sp.]|uniref:SDR family NAD(P)-dependent oxidoreductase n=1 Tax=Vulgatibacter sp. TaxID=1971226 RepID=UPI00356A858C